MRKGVNYKCIVFVIAFFFFHISKDAYSQASSTTNTVGQQKSVISVGVPFLLVGPDARASAMGDAQVAISDNVSAVYWNPAGLGSQKGFEIMFTHNQWMPTLGLTDLVLENLLARFNLKEVGGIGTLGGGFTYFNQGSSQIVNSNGTPNGTFYSYELALWFCYGIEVIPGLSLGATARFIYSSLADANALAQGPQLQNYTGNASSVSFDIGLLWRPFFYGWMGDKLSFGFNLSNLGPKIKYLSEATADPLPTNLRLGFAFSPWKTDYNTLTITADFNRIIATRKTITTSTGAIQQVSDDVFNAFVSTWGAYGIAPVTVGIGLEYWYGKPKLFSFRAGYFYESPEAGGRSYVSFGIGLRYWILGIDFSYLQGTVADHPLSSTIRASIIINLEPFLSLKDKKKK